MVDAALRRLGEFITLSASEIEAFNRTRAETRNVEARSPIRSQGDPVREIFLLAEGWVISAVDARDGSRQITKIHLPGDLLGVPSVALTHAAETLSALTPTVVERIPLKAFGSLFQAAPRLAASIFLSSQKERVLLMDRLTSIGRTTADGRVSAFLLLMLDRLQRIDPEVTDTFELPLTQSHLAEVLGLTAVHINRTLRSMDEAGIIERRGCRFRLADLEALRERAAVLPRSFVREPEWLLQLGEAGELKA
ncbi:MAG: Crp/Fnr family transcriptional regulator [Sphingomonas sp.]|nr:Crp/Fnr family transcriptional regulator [Sphingomonas sp.]